MADDESPAEVVDDVTEQPNALPDDAVSHEPPPWVETIIQAVESLPDKIAAALPNPVSSEVVENPTEDETHESSDQGPGDESPAAKPWTHRFM